MFKSLRTRYTDGVWNEKRANIRGFNEFLNSSAFRNAGLDSDLFPVIVALNRLPFSYSVMLSCSGTLHDHEQTEKPHKNYGQINCFPKKDGSYTDNESNQGYFCGRFDVSHEAFPNLKTDLESLALDFEEVSLVPHRGSDFKPIIDPKGKTYRVHHYHHNNENMTVFWLNVALTMNKYIPQVRTDPNSYNH